MRVRASLAFAIDAGPGVLNESGGLTQAAVRPAAAPNWEHSYASASIVRHQGVLTGLVECDVTRVGTTRGDFVEER